MEVFLWILGSAAVVFLILLIRELWTVPMYDEETCRWYLTKEDIDEYLEAKQKESDKALGIERFYHPDPKTLQAVWQMSMDTHNVHEVMTMKYSKKHKTEVCYMSLIKKS